MNLDLILRNALVQPGSSAPRTHAVGVKDGRVVVLGDDAEIATAAHSIDLDGRTVLPGFHDAHAHTARYGMGLRQLDLSSAKSLDDVYRLVGRQALTMPRDSWLIGHSYDHLKFGGTHPHRDSLDQVAPHHKVWLKHRTEHMGVANSMALAETGVDAFSVISGGTIERDVDGRMTGFLVETAQSFINDCIVPVSTADLVTAIAAAHQNYLSEGIVACQEAGIGGGWIGLSPDEALAYQAALSGGQLQVRTTLMPTFEALERVGAPGGDALRLPRGVPETFGSDMLRWGAVKIFADGALSAKTAAMHDAFCHDPGNAGILQLDPESLFDRIEVAHRSGWQIATHAIGDRAIGLVLDAYASVLARWPRDDARHRIEHCSVTNPRHVERMAELGVIPVMQTYFVHALGDAALENLGPGRAAWCYRLRSLLEAGVPVAASSDRPIADGAPLKAVQRMLRRVTAGGQDFQRREEIDFDNALTVSTAHPARSAFLEQEIGTIRPGMRADFAVLDSHPDSVAASAIEDIGIEATLIDGVALFDRSGLWARVASPPSTSGRG